MRFLLIMLSIVSNVSSIDGSRQVGSSGVLQVTTTIGGRCEAAPLVVIESGINCRADIVARPVVEGEKIVKIYESYSCEEAYINEDPFLTHLTLTTSLDFPNTELPQ